MAHTKDFTNWNTKKIQTENHQNKRSFREREIWSIIMGENIGYEQCGRGTDFLRPVIIYKKFSKNLFLDIPLTSTIRTTKFYSNFTFRGAESSAILSQIRLYDAKRLKYAKGRLSTGDYNRIKNNLIALLQ